MQSKTCQIESQLPRDWLRVCLAPGFTWLHFVYLAYTEPRLFDRKHILELLSSDLSSWLVFPRKMDMLCSPKVNSPTSQSPVRIESSVFIGLFLSKLETSSELR